MVTARGRSKNICNYCNAGKERKTQESHYRPKKSDISGCLRVRLEERWGKPMGLDSVPFLKPIGRGNDIIGLQRPRPATGVSWALWAQSVPGVSFGVSLGPFGPRAPECPRSVPGVSPECQKGHSGARGPKGRRDTQGKTKGQQLKAKNVSNFFTLFHNFSIFHNFSHFFRIFPPGTFPFKTKGFSSMRTKEKKKITGQIDVARLLLHVCPPPRHPEGHFRETWPRDSCSRPGGVAIFGDSPNMAEFFGRYGLDEQSGCHLLWLASVKRSGSHLTEREALWREASLRNWRVIISGQKKVYTTTVETLHFSLFSVSETSMVYTLLSGPMVYTLLTCFPRKGIPHSFFCSVTSGSGDRPRKEGCHSGGVQFFVPLNFQS